MFTRAAGLLTIVALAGSLSIRVGAATATTLPSISAHSAVVMAAPFETWLRFQVSLSASSASTVTVNYSTVNGTAIAGKNYQSASGTVSIPAGSRSALVSVPVLPVTEGAGGSSVTLSLDLADPSGAALGTASATGTIHPDVYLAAHTGSLQDAVVGPGSGTAYITNASANEVERLSLATGSYGRPIFVGSDPAGLDITPDGKTLYVCDSGGQAISVVDVNTGKVTKTIATPAGFDGERAFSIAIANNGTALFTTTFSGSGYGAHIYSLNLSTDAINAFTAAGVNGLVTEDAPLVRSADHSTIAGVVGDESGGSFFVARPKDGTVVNGSLNDFIQYAALSPSGSQLAIDPASYGSGAGTYVVDPTSGALLGTVAGRAYGLAFDGTKGNGFRLQSGMLGVFSSSRFLQMTAYNEPDATSPGLVVISPDAKMVLSLTAHGVTLLKS